MFERDYTPWRAFITNPCFFLVYLNVCRLSTLPWFISLSFLPFSLSAPLYIAHFYSFSPFFSFFSYSMCISICLLEKLNNNCCFWNQYVSWSFLFLQIFPFFPLFFFSLLFLLFNIYSIVFCRHLLGPRFRMGPGFL